MEDNEFIGYCYNRIQRNETSIATNLYFKLNEDKFKNMTDEEISKFIIDNPE